MNGAPSRLGPFGGLLVAHAGEDAAHVGEALEDARHGVFGVNLVFEIDVAGVANVDERLEDGADGHDALADGNLRFLGSGVGEILDMDVVEARAGGVDGGDDVGSGAQGVAEVDAEADARVQILDGGEDVEG